MIILAIETSCDETAASVLKATGSFNPPSGGPKFTILSNVVASQVKIHAPWGGVVPNLAKREHERNLPIVFNKALKKAGFVNLKSQISNLKNIDLIAVTVGPGLEPALWTGINFAKHLAEKWEKPIIPINHLEGHLFSVLLKEKSFGFRASDFGFPAVALLVSGGHTELVLIKDWLKYKIIGETRDDAAGEAFDKVAKMLGLGYPGGPEISKIASKFKSEARSTKFEINLPRPMINTKDYDFSFSGLKTAVLYLLRDLRAEKFSPRRIPLDDRPLGGKFLGDKELLGAICTEFQQAVIDVLIKKTIRAAKEYRARTIILGGGVAANEELRKQFENAVNKLNPKPYWLVAKPSFCTDNAVMIAAAAYFHVLKKDFPDWKNLKADGNLKL